jgi:hypothetical protein
MGQVGHLAKELSDIRQIKQSVPKAGEDSQSSIVRLEGDDKAEPGVIGILLVGWRVDAQGGQVTGKGAR